MQGFENIIIIGYPKSGTTWLTRLVAELVSCPVAGFWKSNHAEIAVEGEERESEYRCYKGHHSYEDLIEKGGIENARIVYVVRDPRDVILSASHYFATNIKLDNATFSRKFFREAIIRLLKPDYFRIQRMRDALLTQDSRINYWLKTPWREHVNTYLDKGTFYVRYEDLISEPVAECNRILSYIGINRSEAQVLDAISKQSFADKKQVFIKSKAQDKARFMRVGKSEQWRISMPRKEIIRVQESLKLELDKLGYPILAD